MNGEYPGKSYFPGSVCGFRIKKSTNLRMLRVFARKSFATFRFRKGQLLIDLKSRLRLGPRARQRPRLR